MQVPNHVLHEVFDDEVVVVNMNTGHYFSMSGRASTLWSKISSGETQGEDDLADQLTPFLKVLRTAGLLESDVSPLSDWEQAEALLEGGPLQGTIEKFTDVEGLLLLDPIHEVDEAGWPTAPKS